MDKNSRKITGHDGVERTYHFAPVSVEAAIDLEDELWRLVSEFSGNAGAGMSALFSEKSEEDDAVAAASIASIPVAILQSLSKKKLKYFAKMLLTGCVVDESETKVYRLENGWTDEYFRGRWLERLDAIIEAIDLSFPGYFFQARSHLGAFVKKTLGLISSTAKKESSQTE